MTSAPSPGRPELDVKAPLEPPALTSAVCAAHKDAPSTGTCERCGNFVCPLCLDEFSPLPGHCETCREREGGRIAFEGEGSLWSRWWRTTRDIVFRPTATFESVRPGDLGASIRYALLTGLVVALPITCLLGCAAGVMLGAGMEDDPLPSLMAGMALAYPIVLPVSFMTTALVRACVFHLSIWLLGGSSGFGVSLWSTGYLTGIQAIWLPLGFVRMVPVLGPLLQLLALLAVEVFVAIQLTTVAREYHGLEGGRATMAGWSGLVTAAALFSCCCLLGFAAAFAAP